MNLYIGQKKIAILSCVVLVLLIVGRISPLSPISSSASQGGSAFFARGQADSNGTMINNGGALVNATTPSPFVPHPTNFNLTSASSGDPQDPCTYNSGIQTGTGSCGEGYQGAYGYSSLNGDYTDSPASVTVSVSFGSTTASNLGSGN